MGYTTYFDGGFDLNRDLSHKEWLELKELAGDNRYIQAEYTDTPETIPDSYNQWEPNEDGTQIVWDGAEKFYRYEHWLRWLIKHYMKPRNLVLNGEVRYQGEEIDDAGFIVCKDNVVTDRKLPKGSVHCPNCGEDFVPKND